MRLNITESETGAPLRITDTPNELHAIYTDNLTATDFARMSQHFNAMVSIANSAKVFADASERSRGVVILNPDFGCLPMIIGQDGEPVLMYKFVEVLHEIVGLGEIQRELPSLSYGQIEGGITFLRALTQFNVRGVDIDSEEEQLLEASPKFQQQVKDALNLETTRVFPIEQQTV